ncbi:RHS repeat-associated core domain-containing protein [Paenibacillus ferrarius]|uniref:RHS repeat-associated core domain-containing protein n=1 Tax=Paenibacillus ferrarius TaxID=1469647 RepID=UPI003D2B7587
MRYKKTSGTQTIQYQYDVSGQVIAESNSNNLITANYIRGDRLLAKKDVSTGQMYYYLYNGHGDVTQIVDRNGNIVNSYQYDEWGNITSQTEGIANSFKYAGEQYDAETGLYYLRARYYDPSMGRFINEDSYEGQIDNPLSLNLYTYGHNNPLRFIDPTGHSAATASYSQNQEDYLNSLGSNGWAQGQIDDKRWYVDENGDVFSKDEVLRAQHPEWYGSSSSSSSSGASTPVSSPSSSNSSPSSSGPLLNVTPMDQKDILPIRDGCFATAVAMVINYVTGSNLTVPGTYNKYNTSSGLSWSVFSDNNVTQTRVSANLSQTIDAINNNFNDNLPTIVSLPSYPHFVVAISSGNTAEDIVVIDPWGGAQMSLQQAAATYGSVGGYRVIK